MHTAPTERQVPVGGAREIQFVRPVERVLVEVARDVPEHHLVAGLDRLAAELVVLERRAAEVHERGAPAEELFHRGVDPPLEVLQQPRLLI